MKMAMFTKEDKFLDSIKSKKAKLSPFAEDVWGSGCIDPRFLHLDTSWK
jgi:hypothetical protein